MSLKAPLRGLSDLRACLPSYHLPLSSPLRGISRNFPKKLLHQLHACLQKRSEPQVPTMMPFGSEKHPQRGEPQKKSFEDQVRAPAAILPRRRSSANTCAHRSFLDRRCRVRYLKDQRNVHSVARHKERVPRAR